MNPEPILLPTRQRKILPVKPCVICGREMRMGAMEQKRGKATCSTECKAKLLSSRAKGAREHRPCEVCGTVCSKKPSVAARGKAWFCSLSCKSKETMRIRRAQGTYVQPKKPRRGSESPCGHCGKPVYATKRERERGCGQYCNQTCHNEAQKKGETKPCLACGKLYHKRPSMRGSRVCSRECYDKVRFKNGVGRIHNGKQARLNANGYVVVWEPGFPGVKRGGWALEHRVVMSRLMGRDLNLKEHVHHKNGNKQDNRPENLEIMDPSTHGKTTGEETKEKRKAIADELAEYRKRFGPLPA